MLQENNFFRCSILPIVQPQQWGTGNGYEGANPSWGKGHDTQFVIFPIAFTKQAFCCIVTPIGGGQGSDRVYSLSVKSFQILCGTNMMVYG